MEIPVPSHTTPREAARENFVNPCQARTHQGLN